VFASCIHCVLAFFPAVPRTAGGIVPRNVHGQTGSTVVEIRFGREGKVRVTTGFIESFLGFL
jgi:hypothetical protein